MGALADQPEPPQDRVAAAKAGVVALSEQLRAEVALRGVRVSVICPSFFRTNLCDTAIGNPATKALALKLMDSAPDTIDSVADKVFADAEKGRFLILPTRREPMRWRRFVGRRRCRCGW